MMVPFFAFLGDKKKVRRDDGEIRLVITPLEHRGQRFQPERHAILREVRYRDLAQNVVDDLMYATDGIYDRARIETLAGGRRIL